MDARELRIGNLVYADAELHEIRPVDFRNAHLFNPIEITDAWLIKLGARNEDKHNDYFLNHNNSYYINKNSTTGFFHLYEQGGEDYLVKENIEHIHQLQNLYFALTGEELTVAN
jgi:hypothetical protein